MNHPMPYALPPGGITWSYGHVTIYLSESVLYVSSIKIKILFYLMHHVLYYFKLKD